MIATRVVADTMASGLGPDLKIQEKIDGIFGWDRKPGPRAGERRRFFEPLADMRDQFKIMVDAFGTGTLAYIACARHLHDAGLVLFEDSMRAAPNFIVPD